MVQIPKLFEKNDNFICPSKVMLIFYQGRDDHLTFCRCFQIPVMQCITGLPEFAECPKHSAKDIKHSANGSPSVTLGEQHSPKTVTVKPTLPSVFYGRPSARHSAKLKPKKTRKNGILPKKWNFFYRWRPPPASAHPSTTFFT